MKNWTQAKKKTNQTDKMGNGHLKMRTDIKETQITQKSKTSAHIDQTSSLT